MSYPVAIGGIGGSGTRIGAALLQRFGYYIGDDLNDSLDNLWFTLLFKRRSVLLDPEPRTALLWSLFMDRLSGDGSSLHRHRHVVLSLAKDERIQSPPELNRIAAAFLERKSTRREGQPWGWKEPNTHVVIDRFLRSHGCLRYIHFVRHPLAMAVSRNQNQLQNWGPIFLSRDVAIGPRDSLAYWCAAHRRFLSVAERWPDRVMLCDFDAACLDPKSQSARIADFLALDVNASVRSSLSSLVDKDRASAGCATKLDLQQFSRVDLHYIQELGYDLSGWQEPV